MSHDPSHDDALFAAVTPQIQALVLSGAAAVAAHTQDLAAAFQLQDRAIRCIDEGTPGGISFAGSGILAPFEDAVAWMRAANATAVTSHVHCGAAGLAAKRDGHAPEAADALARAHAKKLAEALNVPYEEHIERLDRPEHLHDAIAVYVDGTGKFDPSRVPGLPKGFVVSWRYLDAEYAQQEVEIAISIALGDHGFGARFTPTLPFHIIAVGDPAVPGMSRAAIEEKLHGLIAPHEGRVRIDGFDAPA